MDDLYREVIIEHYKNPSYKGTLDPHDISFEDENPLCGDHIRIDLRVDQAGIITEAAFSGHGCAISLASADLLLETVVGKDVEDVKKFSKEQLLELLGIELGPVRLKCALLPLKILKAGVYGVGESGDVLLAEES
ncbi:MAG: SUF system NifU family Fe-S cluster assembly protein [Anaerolineaceae bacterium]|nr:SUF system NifU family Fe-S cluster assembly protein [Anaerolineaceae bacterium]